MKDLVIVGAGAMAREILWMVKEYNDVKPEYNVLGFLDYFADGRSLSGFECTHKVIGTIESWEPEEDQYFVMGIQNAKYKRDAVAVLKGKGAKFISLIHPTCMVADTAKYGEGFVLYSYCKLGPNCKIGDFVASQSTIPHDCVVGDYSKISGMCGIGGGVEIGHDAFLATGVCIVPHKKIGPNAQVGIGSVVVGNIPENAKVFGNPAKRMEM